MWIVLPDYPSLNIVVTAFTLCFTFLLLFKDLDKIKAFAQSSYFKEFTGTIISGVLILCILGLVNYLSFKYPRGFDFSFDKLNTLSDQSKQIIKKLEKPLKVKVFARNENAAPYVSLLELYRLEAINTGKLINVDVLDPDLNPAQVAKYRVSKTPAAVFEYGEKLVLASETSERAMSSALIKVIRKSDPMAYFVSDKGSPNPSDKGDQGFSQIATKLSLNNFTVANISLMQVPQIPLDAGMLIILAPLKSFTDNEVAKIKTYLDNGGRLLIGLGPNLQKDLFANIKEMLRGYGVRIGRDLVIDKASYVSGSNGWIPIVKTYNTSHILTKDFTQATFFPLTTSIIGEKSDASFERRSLFFSSNYPGSWAEKNFEDLIKNITSYDQTSDIAGPIPLAVSVENVKNEMRIIALGNGTFVQNVYENQGGNFDFFLNTASWLAGESFVISSQRNESSQNVMVISAPQMATIFYFSVLFCPIVLLLNAFVVYRRTRVY